MPNYQIHRLQESQLKKFRWEPHTSGRATAKPTDYTPGISIEGESPYAVWRALRGTPDELRVGDILETSSGELRIYKYVGFEEARWLVPEDTGKLETRPASDEPSVKNI